MSRFFNWYKKIQNSIQRILQWQGMQENAACRSPLTRQCPMLDADVASVWCDFFILAKLCIDHSQFFSLLHQKMTKSKKQRWNRKRLLCLLVEIRTQIASWLLIRIYWPWNLPLPMKCNMRRNKWCNKEQKPKRAAAFGRCRQWNKLLSTQYPVFENCSLKFVPLLLMYHKHLTIVWDRYYELPKCQS